MFKSIMKKDPILSIMNNSLIILATPVNISTLWNFGSILGMCLMIQILSGLFLSMHYCPNVNYAFMSIIHIIQDVNYGWIIRNIHMNGASLYFMCMYIHLSRGLYYHSFKLKHTWMMGVSILLISMMTAFLGYVLPWGQMSLWGATVITNLLSAIPFIGQMIVEWIWGGFSIGNMTLNRFYSIHFIMPFIILLMVIIHLTYLHKTGSSNPTGLNSNLYKVYFNCHFTTKDILGFLMIIMLLFIMILQYPYLLNDPDNFSMANSMVTPTHIKPEWYFLFAYTILRSIPNKLGGVIALLLSILILYTLPFTTSKMKSASFYPLNQIIFWYFLNICILLTWLGAKEIEYPYIQISQLTAILYFMYFLSFSMINNKWDNLLK